MTPSSPEPATAELQRVFDLEAIQSLKARYCIYIDTKQWQALGALFWSDAHFDGFRSAPSGSNLNTFLSGVASLLQDSVSIHHCHMPEVRFDGQDRARAIWAMMDYVQWPQGRQPRDLADHSGFCGYGHYEEEYRREGKEWRIVHMRLTRLRIDTLPLEHPAPRRGMLSASADWLTMWP